MIQLLNGSLTRSIFLIVCECRNNDYDCLLVEVMIFCEFGTGSFVVYADENAKIILTMQATANSLLPFPMAAQSPMQKKRNISQCAFFNMCVALLSKSPSFQITVHFQSLKFEAHCCTSFAGVKNLYLVVYIFLVILIRVRLRFLKNYNL